MRTRTHHPSAATLAAVTLVAALGLAGCGGSSDDAGPGAGASSSGSSSDSSTSGPQLDVTVAGDKVTPAGDRIKLAVGQTLTIHVTADREGELHVHSTPEQELSYKKGDTTVSLTIDKPGIVDVEDHVADVVVAQLEVS